MPLIDMAVAVLIYRRDPSRPPADDIGIQRRHIPERSSEIFRYLSDGFPLSRINRRKLVDQNEVTSLRMPGWIPTAIIANILVKADRRGPNKKGVPAEDLITVEQTSDTLAHLQVPTRILDSNWRPVVHPIEIIDGQHRLWALEESQAAQQTLWSDDFRRELEKLEIPVVAFSGLDRTWQAYLFYTINQLPKRVDSSLVYDLYPLLRDQEWLDRIEGPEVYRDSRAQDLTILLWQHPQSPWHNRILRHGGRTPGMVTQASMIRSLTKSFIRTYNPAKGVGGLFGACKGSHDTELTWCREQQAAFLIMVWQELRDATRDTKAPWAKELRKLATGADKTPSDELALIPFQGENSLLATDQGCRVVLLVANDFSKKAHEDGELSLDKYSWERSFDQDDLNAVEDALSTLRKQLKSAVSFVKELANSLATFDWRSSSSVPRNDQNFDRQSSYRGSSGYRALRHYVLEHLNITTTGSIKRLAEEFLAESHTPDGDAD